jgi:signal peptidase I
MSSPNPKRSTLAVRILLMSPTIAVVVAIFVSAVFFGRWRIPQAGMFPTYRAGGQIIARKSPYSSIADVRRGDIVIYKHMRDGARFDLIWRVVGLPGERVAIRADAVLVNGRALPQRPLRQQDGQAIVEETADGHVYEIALPATPDGHGDLAEVEVPPGHLFALGDNRHEAADCRSSGPLPFEAIIAKAIW